MMIANPEGTLMPMNTVQGGLENASAYCTAGHLRDGINYPSPGGGCTACFYEAAGMHIPAFGLPIPDADPAAVLAARTARESQPMPAGVSPLYG